MIHLLTAVGLSPGDSSTVHIYTQKIHRTTQKIFEDWVAVPRPCVLYPGIYLTTEEKTRKTLSQGSRTIRIHRPNNKNTQITVLNRNTTIYIDKKRNLKDMK